MPAGGIAMHMSNTRIKLHRHFRLQQIDNGSISPQAALFHVDVQGPDNSIRKYNIHVIFVMKVMLASSAWLSAAKTQLPDTWGMEKLLQMESKQKHIYTVCSMQYTAYTNILETS